MKEVTITADEIEALTTAFYARIRQHDILGPVFLDAVGSSHTDWQAHEAKIASFWRNATGIDRSYSGNPMTVHGSNTAIQPEHFPIWLALFRNTAERILDPVPAAAITTLADRIGQSLSFGITQFRQRTNTPPDLRAK